MSSIGSLPTFSLFPFLRAGGIFIITLKGRAKGRPAGWQFLASPELTGCTGAEEKGRV